MSSNMKTLTAEEFMHANLEAMDNVDVERVMIEFAKLHVGAALEAAASDAHTTLVPFTDNEQQVDKESILTAYPLTNIK